MVVITSRQPSVVLYSNGKDQYCHRVRLVLAAKGVSADIINVRGNEHKEEIASFNPHGTLPTLRDRGFGVFNSLIIMYYLDERFPHPSLLPSYPEDRTRLRMLIHDLENSWCQPAEKLLQSKGSPKVLAGIHAELTEDLTSVAPIFFSEQIPDGEDLTLLDCFLIPFLWRLDLIKIKISESTRKHIETYMRRVSKHPAFQVSLSVEEREMHTS